MYTRILVPLDGSDTAEQVLPYAKLLSKGLEAEIQLLRVIDGPSVDAIDPTNTAFIIEVAETARTQTEEYLNKIAQTLRNEGLETATISLEGDPASQIIAQSEREPNTLVAISTHGRSGISRWLMGSITDKVIHGGVAPMLVVRSQEPAASTEIDLKCLVVPLDGSELAEQVLPHAVALAKALALKMMLLRVTPSAGDYFRYMDYPPADYEDLAREVDDDAARYLNNINRRVKLDGISESEVHLVHGAAPIAINDFVQGVPNTIVAMTTHGRSGLGRWVLGSVADRVVQQSGSPVLLVRAGETEEG